jgi:hypothetical protein
MFFLLQFLACEVCDDKSTGKHYGVYCCDGCSGFFKRTVRRSIPWLCRNNNQCVVDRASRTDCRACRFKKCLMVNMNPEGMVLYPLLHLTMSIFCVCVGVMYSGEYDVCDVTLSVHPHQCVSVDLDPSQNGPPGPNPLANIYYLELLSALTLNCSNKNGK